VCLAMHRYTTPAVGSTSDSVLDKSDLCAPINFHR